MSDLDTLALGIFVLVSLVEVFVIRLIWRHT
jgi:hypothetical protein